MGWRHDKASDAHRADGEQITMAKLGQSGGRTTSWPYR
jgi:hypothetical protein